VLKIVTTPFEALIELNGKDYGTSPQTIRKLPIGTYNLELSKAGYDKLIKQLEIKDNKITELNEVLSISQLVTVKTKPKFEDKKAKSEIVKEGKDSKITPGKAEDVKKTKVKTTYKSSVKVGKIILMSSVVPGLGLTKLSNGKPYWLIGVAGGGCLVTSVYYNKRAASSYDDYLNPVDVNEVKNDYDNAIKQQNLSKILAISAVTIWVTDLAFTSIKVLKMKKSISYNGKNTLSIGYIFNPVNAAPMLSMNFKF